MANGYEFYAIGVDAEKRLSGWAEDMLRRANPEMIFRMHGSLHSELRTGRRAANWCAWPGSG